RRIGHYSSGLRGIHIPRLCPICFSRLVSLLAHWYSGIGSAIFVRAPLPRQTGLGFDLCCRIALFGNSRLEWQPRADGGRAFRSGPLNWLVSSSAYSRSIATKPKAARTRRRGNGSAGHDGPLMLSLSDTQINQALKPYGVLPAADLTAGIRTYIELLLKWNKTVSLTTVTDLDQILAFHFGESLFALPMLPVEKSRVADVGSGAGFPGIPLAMARPSLDVTLIEPNAKKFAFLNEVVRKLSLAKVRAVRGRTGDLQFSDEEFEVVTARAVGEFDDLLGWAK